MRKKVLSLILAITLALSVCLPVSAKGLPGSEGGINLAPESQDSSNSPYPDGPIGTAPVSEEWKIWSQSDERWGALSISSYGSSSYNMAREGCLVTAIAKILVYSGQQDPVSFTPADCLAGMHKYDLLSASGALYSGDRMNNPDGFLQEFGPELTYVPQQPHGAWSRQRSCSTVESMIESGMYVIVRVPNYSTGNSHYMAVERVADNTIYVMDNKEVIDLFASSKYGGVSQALGFIYSGPLPYPARDAILADSLPDIPEEDMLPGFRAVKTYYYGLFLDVAADEWYHDGVARAYESGLMSAADGRTFGVGQSFTVAEAIVLAAKLHTTYYYGSAGFYEPEDAWYENYVNYAEINGLIDEGQFTDYERPITVAELVTVLSCALPDAALEAINNVPNKLIPDVTVANGYSHHAYRFYEAGILTGSDGTYALGGDRVVTREMAAVILSRIIVLSLRESIDTPAENAV